MKRLQIWNFFFCFDSSNIPIYEGNLGTHKDLYYTRMAFDIIFNTEILSVEYTFGKTRDTTKTFQISYYKIQPMNIPRFQTSKNTICWIVKKKKKQTNNIKQINKEDSIHVNLFTLMEKLRCWFVEFLQRHRNNWSGIFYEGQNYQRFGSKRLIQLFRFINIVTYRFRCGLLLNLILLLLVEMFNVSVYVRREMTTE